MRKCAIASLVVFFSSLVYVLCLTMCFTINEHIVPHLASNLGTALYYETTSDCHERECVYDLHPACFNVHRTQYSTVQTLRWCRV
uniref:Putative secreted protein n=1 Tax=Anopheles darlingi TaxID=43151 RepID=A0A2M4DD80_ANODA